MLSVTSTYSAKMSHPFPPQSKGDKRQIEERALPYERQERTTIQELDSLRMRIIEELV